MYGTVHVVQCRHCTEQALPSDVHCSMHSSPALYVHLLTLYNHVHLIRHDSHVPVVQRFTNTTRGAPRRSTTDYYSYYYYKCRTCEIIARTR